MPPSRFPVILLALLLARLPFGVAAAQPAAPTWVPLPDALAEAAATGRPTLVYVHAPWCGPCARMERDVFPDAEVATLLGRFALARLDYDDHDSRLVVAGRRRTSAAWARHLGADATPGFVFLAPDGKAIARANGAHDAPAFRLLLAYVATGAHRHASLDAYARQTADALPDAPALTDSRP